MKQIKFLIALTFVLSLSSLNNVALAFDINIIDQNGKAVEEIVVTLTPTNRSTADMTQVTQNQTKIMQRDYMFEPRMAIVQKGQSVSFPNYDKTHHNVYSFSESKEFELPLYYGQSPEITFDKSGIIVLGCNIHDWMLAYLIVVDTPFYALTNKKGTATFQNVPDGEYTLSYWYKSLDPRKGLQDSQKVHVSKEKHKMDLQLRIKNTQKWPKKPIYIEKKY